VAQETGYAEIPHTRMRRAIAARLTESAQTAPHFYLRAAVRVDKLLKLRARLNKQSTTRISVNDLIVKAAARAHTLVPEMNVIWTSDAVRQYKKVDIGVAVATERGLFTPVLTDVANRSITNVAEAGKELVRRAKAGQLKQDDLTGGTLSITNLGMFGVEEFAAIINPPQAAILAVGAIRRAPAAGKNKLVRVTLSVDHRPVDGVVAARWLAAFVETVEKPLRILA
jgi:pyruvate dehydrogenase E2 component (dihydrolipoamide acetyltransferase)